VASVGSCTTVIACGQSNGIVTVAKG